MKPLNILQPMERHYCEIGYFGGTNLTFMLLDWINLELQYYTSLIHGKPLPANKYISCL